MIICTNESKALPEDQCPDCGVMRRYWQRSSQVKVQADVKGSVRHGNGLTALPWKKYEITSNKSEKQPEKSCEGCEYDGAFTPNSKAQQHVCRECLKTNFSYFTSKQPEKSCGNCTKYDVKRITDVIGSCACVYGTVAMQECIRNGYHNFTPKKQQEDDIKLRMPFTVDWANMIQDHENKIPELEEILSKIISQLHNETTLNGIRIPTLLADRLQADSIRFAELNNRIKRLEEKHEL